MSAVRLAVLAVAGVVALSMTGVRVSNHPAYVRVVVDFNGRVPANRIELDHDSPTFIVVHISHRGVSKPSRQYTGRGVRVLLQQGAGYLDTSAVFRPYRFKYVSYAARGNRLLIDLWKSAPPTKATVTCPGLSIQTWGVQPGVVVVSGKGRGIFENTFEVVVRGANGRVLGRRTNVHARRTWPGAWGARVHYKASHRQTGTLEAVAFSPKDGSLACLAQVRVTLPAS